MCTPVSPIEDKMKHMGARRLGHVKRGHLEVIDKVKRTSTLQEEEVEGRPNKKIQVRL